MDGRRFVRCSFDECTLVTESGLFSIDGCKLTKCTFQFMGSSITVFKFAMVSLLAAGLVTPEAYANVNPILRPTMDPDFRISL